MSHQESLDELYIPLNDIDAWETALDESERGYVIIFKHSGTCPISSEAHDEITSFAETNNEVSLYKLVVQDSKELARMIAEDLDIKHETPQVIVLQNREPIFVANHERVTASVLEEKIR
jgi:bacillithiol system protein YtxJ